LHTRLSASTFPRGLFHPLEFVDAKRLAIGVTVFHIGLDPLAAAIIGYVGAFYGLFQHWNVAHAALAGYVIQ